MQQKFLPGKAVEDDCVEEWSEYQECLKKKLEAWSLSDLKRPAGEKPPDIIDKVKKWKKKTS